MNTLPAYISAMYPSLFILRDGVSVRRLSRAKNAIRLEAIDSFLDARVENGMVVIARAGHKRRRPTRKEREKAAGNGWTQDEWLAHVSVYGDQCLKCGTTESLVPDHVIPLCRGGSHSLENIQPLCKKCNFLKGITIVDYRSKANPLLWVA